MSSLLSAVNKSLASLGETTDAMAKVAEMDKMAAATERKFSRLALPVDKEDTEEDKELDKLQESVAKWIDSSYAFSFWSVSAVVKAKAQYIAQLMKK